MRHYVIIGSGPGGIAACEAIRRHDASGEIVVIGDEPYGYYSRPGLAYLLTGEISEKNLFPFSQEDYRHLGSKFLHGRANRIQPADHTVIVQNHTTHPVVYDRLLIATGSTAMRISNPGCELEGVVKLDNLDDARRIIKLARKAKTALVVGGGITALEIVEGLVSRGVKVHYFLRGDRYWSNVLDETESRVIEERLVDEGVHIHFHTELAEIIGNRGRVAGVKTTKGEMLKCDLVAVAIGVRPRKELAEASGLKTDRGVVVNDALQTSDADIFAAGDVAQVYDPLTGKSILDTLWAPARDQGYVAGLNMAGQTTFFHKEPAFNVTRLACLTTTIIGAVGRGDDPDLLGIARGDSETFRQLPDAIAAQSNFDVNRLRVLVGTSTLIGGIVMGDQTLSKAIQVIVANRVDITPIRQHLLTPGVPLGDLIADFWTRWKTTDASKQS